MPKIEEIEVLILNIDPEQTIATLQKTDNQ